MHRYSIGSIKGGQGSGQLRDRPHEGTKLRALWDYLYAHKGEFVTIDHIYETWNGRSTAMRQLIDQYSLDIRIHRTWAKGRRGANPSLYCLAGEWDGKAYIDYVADRMQDGSQKPS